MVGLEDIFCSIFAAYFPIVQCELPRSKNYFPSYVTGVFYCTPGLGMYTVYVETDFHSSYQAV